MRRGQDVKFTCFRSRYLGRTCVISYLLPIFERMLLPPPSLIMEATGTSSIPR